MDISSLPTATRAHHPDSPSSIGPSNACAGFQNEQRETEAAAKGTLQHTATEKRDLSILDGDEVLEVAVTKAIAYEDAVISRFRLSGPCEIRREVQLSVGDDLVGAFRGITSGFVDTLIVGRTAGAIIDFKFGVVPVEASKDNLQGIAYTLGAFQAYPELNTIEVNFYAPNVPLSVEEQEKKYVHVFHRREIPALELRIRTVIARKHKAAEEIARGDWSRCTPKHDLCLWCSRRADCPKVNAIIVSAVSKYNDLAVPEELKEYRLDTPERVASAYKFASALEGICAAVKKRCTDAAVTENMIPDGYTVVRNVRREVVNPRKFLEVAIDCGLPEEDAVNLINIPITSFEKALKEKAGKGKGAPAVRVFAEKLAESGATAEGKPYYFLREQRKETAISVSSTTTQ